jgi:hypothetical protein
MTTEGSQADVTALFASSTLLALLRVFVLEPEREYYQREVQRLTGAHLRQVQRDLERLERAGLVGKSTHGNRTYYRAIADHPALADLAPFILAVTGQSAGQVRDMSAAPSSARIDLDVDEIAAFCRRWDITELALFGSVLRADFGPESDVDVLATFAPDAGRSLFDYAEMSAELAAIVGHRVDIVNREAVEKSANWIRRRAILESAELVYAA